MADVSVDQAPCDALVSQEEPDNELDQVRRQLAIANDALRRSEELHAEGCARQTELRSELQHRVRNLLATIRVVFSRTMETADTLQEATDHFTGRLDTFARYQSMFVRSPDLAIDVETLIRDELLTLGFGDGDRVTIQGPVVHLPHGVVDAIGLAVHELATNSVKYGALSAHAGRLHVRWRTHPDGPFGLVIEWLESGVPIVASAPFRTGFGRDYIETGLPFQIDADTTFELRPGGLVCRIALLHKALQL